MMIKKHMETTEALTKAKKPRHSQSYIEAENGKLYKKSHDY